MTNSDGGILVKAILNLTLSIDGFVVMRVVKEIKIFQDLDLMPEELSIQLPNQKCFSSIYKRCFNADKNSIEITPENDIALQTIKLEDLERYSEELVDNGFDILNSPKEASESLRLATTYDNSTSTVSFSLFLISILCTVAAVLEVETPINLTSIAISSFIAAGLFVVKARITFNNFQKRFSQLFYNQTKVEG